MQAKAADAAHILVCWSRRAVQRVVGDAPVLWARVGRERQGGGVNVAGYFVQLQLAALVGETPKELQLALDPEGHDGLAHEELSGAVRQAVLCEHTLI